MDKSTSNSETRKESIVMIIANKTTESGIVGRKMS